MTLETLEVKIRDRFLENFSEKELARKREYFLIQLRGAYHQKEIKFTDFITNERPVLIVKAETWEECYEELLASIF